MERTLKIFPLVSILSAMVWFAPARLSATAVGTSTVEQPVNLGQNSDPTRIPLGRVGVINNHNYGIHRMIFEARPAPDGAMRWAGGSELDQNLASVFGISLEIPDSTQIRAFPVTLRLKPWKAPAYSPYTKEQVLAATLWCLIRSTNSTPESPLDVQVVADGAEDKALEGKFSGKFVAGSNKTDVKVPPIKIPGTIIEEDARGISWVVFPDVPMKENFTPLSPTMIITESGGDGDAGWYLLPVWGNETAEKDFLRTSNWAATMCYSSWRSRGVTNANTFVAEGGSVIFDSLRDEKSDSVEIGYPRVEQDTLAAEILALIVSAQPTEAHPLKVSVWLEEQQLAGFSAFRNSSDWKESWNDVNKVTLECEFVWDAAARKLAKGSVPLITLEASRNFISPLPDAPPAANAVPASRN